MTESTYVYPTSFLWSTITIVLTVLRLILILEPIIGSSSSSIALMIRTMVRSTGFDQSSTTTTTTTSQTLASILVRPYQTLSHLVEAKSIQNLVPTSTSVLHGDLTGLYSTNNSIRIPPLILKGFLTTILETHHPAIWIRVLSLIVDIAISILLERIAIRRLLEPGGNMYLNVEETLQSHMPSSIRPPFDHIFPILRDSSSSSSSPYVEENNDEGGHNDNDSNNKNTKSSFFTPSSPKFSMKYIPVGMALLYYCNPTTIIPSTVYGSWQNIPYLFLLLSLYESCRRYGSITLSTFWLSIAAYFDPSMIVFLIPLIGMKISSPTTSSSSPPPTITSITSFPKNSRVIVMFGIVFFILWTVCLHMLAIQLVGSNVDLYINKVLLASYGDAWLPTRPNLSMQWYFHMEMFTRFRIYFGTMFATIPLVVVGPSAIRFIRYPEVLVATLAFISTIFRPVQVMLDGNMALLLLLLSPRSLSRMGLASLISLCCLLVPVILNVVDNWMWLSVNNGNANYMFFQCLAYNVFMAVILSQFVSASVQRDKALRMVQKKLQNDTEGTEKVKDS